MPLRHLPSPGRHRVLTQSAWGIAIRRIVLGIVACALVAGASASAQQSVTATWDANTDPYTVGYRLFGGTQPGVYSWNADVGNTTSASLPTLSQAGTYYFVVRAYNAAGELGPPSNEESLTVGVPGGVPGAPTSLAASSAGLRVTLTWAPPAGGSAASNYLVYAGTAPGLWNLVNAYGVGNQLSAAGDLGPGRYYARVQAANQFGAGPMSPEISFVVGGVGVPANPSGLTTAWQGTVLTLRWNAAAGASSYIIEAGSGSGAANLANFSVGAATSYAVDVPPGTYHVRVRAANASGLSGPSNEVVVSGVGGPSRPTALSESSTASSVTLRWFAPTSGPAPTGYILEAGNGPGLANLAVVQIGNQTTFVAAAPPPGTYFVRVRALNARGYSDPSNEIVVRR
jgi:predicted phage tail protein